MNRQVLTHFTNLYSAINNAAALLAGENNPNFENIVRNKYTELNSFNEYIELSNEINEKLYLYPQSNKELFLLNILNGFKYSKYLNITLDNQHEQNRGLTMTADRIKASHNCINNYINGNIDENNICALYIVLCWEELSLFIQELDKLAQSHNLDIFDIQLKAGLNVWYKVTGGIIQNKNTQPILNVTKIFSIDTLLALCEELKNLNIISPTTKEDYFLYAFNGGAKPLDYSKLNVFKGKIGLFVYLISELFTNGGNTDWRVAYEFNIKNPSQVKTGYYNNKNNLPKNHEQIDNLLIKIGLK